MNILITGGTGFIGTGLCDALLKMSHTLVILSRKKKHSAPNTRFISSLETLNPEEVFDVVINLAGEPIANKRWSKAQKSRILNSRLKTTQALIDYLGKAHTKPNTLISGSAIGYYGIAKNDACITENADSDNSFSSQLCQQWEALATQATCYGVRVCKLRTGLVLGKKGGVLNKLLPQYKFGLGGEIGNAEQWMAWIHIDDMINIILYCMQNPTIDGAINCTSPNPVTNREFNESLAHSLKRPGFMRVPEFMITLLFGQMGKELLLSGKRVIPQKIVKHGFEFNYPTLKTALTTLI